MNETPKLMDRAPGKPVVKFKKLVGGGSMQIVNQTVPMALRRLGYTPAQVTAIVEHIDKNETIEGAPGRCFGMWRATRRA